MTEGSRTGFWDRVARLQTRRWWVVLLGVLAVTIAAGSLGRRLTIAAGFEHLLPSGRESVRELDRVSKKTAGVSTLFIVLEAPTNVPADRKKLREASDALTVELRKLGEPWVGSADNGVQEALHFFEKHGGLYAKTEDLQKLHDDIDAYYKQEGGKALVGDFDDEDEKPKEKKAPPFDAASIKKRFNLDDATAERFPDGYFESPDGYVHVVTVRSKVLGGDLDNGTIALKKVREAVERVNLDQYAPGIKVGYAGDLYSGIAEVRAINDDVTEVGIIGGILLAAVVLVYYVRVRTLLLMLLTISVGLVWTSAAAYLIVRQLNTATGFVFTIIAGTGINTGIIYMARYLEARRKGEDVERAIAVAHRETFMATLCAAAASSASFFSLRLTVFRGFRELGEIGGVGLTICWIATLITLPPMLAAFEKIVPALGRGFLSVFPFLKPVSALFARVQAASEQSFGRPFAFIVERAAKVVAIGGVLIGMAGFVALGFYIKSDPFEYDMNKLRNDPRSRVEEERVKHLSDSITGYVGSDGMAILVDDVAQVGPLRDALYAKRDAAPPELKPFEAVVALEDFVPQDQAPKVDLLLKIKKRVEKAHARGAIDEKDWAQIERYLPPDGLKPITMADLPDGIARTFTELDGTRGRIVYIQPTSPALTEDARYLLRWAESYRRTELADGSVVLGSGRAVIYADMWQAVMDAVPVAVLASFVAVAFVVIVTFRAGRPALLVLGALLIGIGWMALGVTIFRTKLNFLNFVALPLTFGIGVDYAVNVVWRATREGPMGALTAVRETGGAVVLSSMTTTLGYLALIGSMNFAVRSLGVAAMLGEVSTLLAAMLVLPGALLWLGSRNKKAAPASEKGTSERAADHST